MKARPHGEGMSLVRLLMRSCRLQSAAKLGRQGKHLVRGGNGFRRRCHGNAAKHHGHGRVRGVRARLLPTTGCEAGADLAGTACSAVAQRAPAPAIELFRRVVSRASTIGSPNLPRVTDEGLQQGLRFASKSKSRARMRRAYTIGASC
jgi:hypothetical protein